MDQRLGLNFPKKFRRVHKLILLFLQFFFTRSSICCNIVHTNDRKELRREEHGDWETKWSEPGSWFSGRCLCAPAGLVFRASRNPKSPNRCKERNTRLKSTPGSRNNKKLTKHEAGLGYPFLYLVIFSPNVNRSAWHCCGLPAPFCTAFSSHNYNQQSWNW